MSGSSPIGRNSAAALDPAADGFSLPNPRGPMPVRRAPGARRTCSIDVTWPAGRRGTMVVHGIGRDVCTLRSGQAPSVLAQDTLRLEISPDRTILSVDTRGASSTLHELVGISRPGILRQVLRDLVTAGALQPSPLYQLADDLPGVLVVADWAWSRWPQLLQPGEQQRRKQKLDRMEGVCAGFAPGSSALRTEGDYQESRQTRVRPLPHPGDPDGWHLLPEYDQVSMRRARCIDVWLDDEIHIDATFQDSATLPSGGRAAVHEYSVRATVSRISHTVTSIAAIPHILPFAECPGALQHLQDVVGTPLNELREGVLKILARTKGCTHLNDAVRALADVPVLAAALLQSGEAPVRKSTQD